MPYLAKLEKAGIPTVLVDLADQHNMVTQESLVSGVPKIRHLHASRTLAKPIAPTLFFAGEAAHTGMTGTVAAALASAQNAAQAMLSLKLP